ncbi:hypothetical protein ACVWXO_003621 [Bradyrhizobium sp. LM2.7]
MKKDDATASRFLASLSNAMKCAIVLGAGVVPASAANLTHSIEVSGAAAEVWSVIWPVLRDQGLAAAGRSVHRGRQIAADPDARHQGRQGLLRRVADRA